MFTRALKDFRNNLIVGLLLVTPIVVTAIVVNWLFRMITGNVLAFLPKHLKQGDQELLLRVAALLLVLVLLFAIGVLVRNFLGKRLYQVGDRVLARIPVINSIYLGTRQVIEALFQQRRTLFQEVVALEYPRPGIYSLGFVTAILPANVHGQLGVSQEEMLSVFIPTTPNPTSGWFCMVPRSQTIKLPMTSGEAMRLVISGGAVFPGDVVKTQKSSLLDLLHEWMADERKPPQAPPPAP